MFVTIITPFDEYRFECDSVRTTNHVPEPPKCEYLYVELYKNSALMATQHVDKSPGNAVYFMNNSGQTIDSFIWHDAPRK
jgi:hypothetical protein